MASSSSTWNVSVMTDEHPDQPSPGGPPYGGPPPAYGAPGQPPGYGQPPAYGQGYGQPGQPAYPQAHLLPQEVHPGKNRRPLVIGLVVAMVLVAGGIGGWLVLRDHGEGTRAEYCAALKTLTNDGDLGSAITGLDSSDARARLDRVRELAPRAVRTDWDTVYDGVDSTQSGEIDVTKVLEAVGALQNIASDADKKCDLQINITGF